MITKSLKKVFLSFNWQDGKEAALNEQKNKEEQLKTFLINISSNQVKKKSSNKEKTETGSRNKPKKQLTDIN